MSMEKEQNRDDLTAPETVEETAALPETAVSQETAEEAADQIADVAEAVTEEIAETVEEIEQGAPSAEEIVETPKKKKSVGGWIALAVALVAAAVVAVLYFTWLNQQTPASVGTVSETGELAFDRSTVRVAGIGSVTAEADEMTDDVAAAVVAENKKLPEKNFFGWVQTVLSGDKTPEIGRLTNAQLSVYYWNSFYQFSNQYYLYADALGLDPAHMEDSEADEGQTWQEFFLSAALSSFRAQNAVYRTALDEGMELPEEYRQDYDRMTEELSAMEDIGEQLQQVYGPGVTLDDYFAFMKANYYYTAYMEKLESELEYTEDDLRAYYEANRDQFPGLELTDAAPVSVRHILIAPTDTENEESWAAAEARAMELYETWKSDGATEDGFAGLAEAESEDPGSASNGGLYEEVVPGQMVEEFNDWCFDPSRQPGDHGVVKTSYGYHIMYFVSAEDAPYWLTKVGDAYKLEIAHETTDAIARGYELQYDLEKIKIPLAGQIRETSDIDAAG